MKMSKILSNLSIDSFQQLRETKRRYENLLGLARSYANHFANLLQTQRALSSFSS